MKDFSIKIKNFEYINKLFKSQISKYNDLYLIPPLPSSSRLASTGLHMSIHASGKSHVRMRLPVACLHIGPQITLPFSKEQFLEDITLKKKLLFTSIDLSNETNGGYIAVLKTESMLKDFLNSTYITSLRENNKYIDYYNLVLTNPYRPSSDFREFFPYKELEIDIKIIENSIITYEAGNLYKSIIEMKNSGTINEADMIILMSYDESFVIIMSGNFIGIKINLNDIEGTINRLPGGTIILPVMKRLLTFLHKRYSGIIS